MFRALGSSSSIYAIRGGFRSTPLTVQVDQNMATLDPYGELFQAGILRIYAAAGADIELPMVPGAAERLSGQVALGQPTFLMGASVSVGVDMVVDVNEQDAGALHVDANHFAAPKVIE
jgi:hypothetical protein